MKEPHGKNQQMKLMREGDISFFFEYLQMYFIFSSPFPILKNSPIGVMLSSPSSWNSIPYNQKLHLMRSS